MDDLNNIRILFQNYTAEESTPEFAWDSAVVPQERMSVIHEGEIYWVQEVSLKGPNIVVAYISKDKPTTLHFGR